MFESKNTTINLTTGNSNSTAAIPNENISIEDSLQIMINSKEVSKKISKKKTIELFGKNNKNYLSKYLTKNQKEESKYKSNIEENNSYTPKDKQEIYWKELKNLLENLCAIWTLLI